MSFSACEAFSKVCHDGQEWYDREAANNKAAFGPENFQKFDYDQVQLTGEGMSGKDGLEQANKDRQTSNKETDKRNSNTRDQLLLLAQKAADFADQRAADAARYEQGFEAQYGDAWREELANRLLGPDEMPIREDGECIEDYRARIEDTMIEKMIDPETGEIRSEYKDDPEYGKLAEWAHAKYEERQARADAEILADPDAEPEALQEAEQRATSSYTMAKKTEQSLDTDSAKLEQYSNDEIDKVANVSNEGGFLVPGA